MPISRHSGDHAKYPRPPLSVYRPIYGKRVQVACEIRLELWPAFLQEVFANAGRVFDLRLAALSSWFPECPGTRKLKDAANSTRAPAAPEERARATACGTAANAPVGTRREWIARVLSVTTGYSGPVRSPRVPCGPVDRCPVPDVASVPDRARFRHARGRQTSSRAGRDRSGQRWNARCLPTR
jgi:hypothetical protein